jgi:hypothetical protein
MKPLSCLRRPHRRTGRPRGKQPGDNWKHGLRSAAFVEQRKLVMALVRQCREALDQVKL